MGDWVVKEGFFEEMAFMTRRFELETFSSWLCGWDLGEKLS